jgi:hypothetical protein
VPVLNFLSGRTRVLLFLHPLVARPCTETPGARQCAAMIGPNTVESALRTLSGSKVYASAAFVAACVPREAVNSLYIYSRPPLPISNPFCDIRVSHHNQQNPQLLPFPSSTPSSPSPPQQRTDHSALFNTFIDPGELRDQDSVCLECLCAFAIAIPFAFSFVAKESSEVHNSVSITIHNTVPVVVGRDQ